MAGDVCRLVTRLLRRQREREGARFGAVYGTRVVEGGSVRGLKRRTKAACGRKLDRPRPAEYHRLIDPAIRGGSLDDSPLPTHHFLDPNRGEG